MKYIFNIFILIFVFASCEKPSDCFQNAGKIISQDVAVTSFDKVVINHGISAVITQGDEYSLIIDAPENLISDIKVEIVDGILKISDNTTCNFTRKYGLTTVHITAPNLTEIHSQTEKNIISNGILNFSNLTLFATDLQDEVGTGDFILELNSNAKIFQRSSNHLHLKPSSSLTGKILSTGNVYCYGIPAVVEVEQPYIGKLIFL